MGPDFGCSRRPATTGCRGCRSPLRPHSLPSKDDVADYLTAYAEQLRCPSGPGSWSTDLRRADGGRGFSWCPPVGTGSRRAEVVVATGAYGTPRVPDSRVSSSPSIRQLHSSGFRDASQLQPGGGPRRRRQQFGRGDRPRSHRTSTRSCCRDRTTGRCRSDPRASWLVSSIPGSGFSSTTSPLRIRRSGARPCHLSATTANPWNASGRRISPPRASSAWSSGRSRRVMACPCSTMAASWTSRTSSGARGSGPSSAWIHLPILGDDGWPLQKRGVVPSAPGLYFVGLPFLYSGASSLLGGVGRDARFIADRIAERTETSRMGRDTRAAVRAG